MREIAASEVTCLYKKANDSHSSVAQVGIGGIGTGSIAPLQLTLDRTQSHIDGHVEINALTVINKEINANVAIVLIIAIVARSESPIRNYFLNFSESRFRAEGRL